MEEYHMHTKEQKKQMEKIMEVFRDYLKESPYAEVVWSDKIGYRKYKMVSAVESVLNPHGLPAERKRRMDRRYPDLCKNSHAQRKCNPVSDKMAA